MTYQQHPLSKAFPAMPEEQFLALKDSIMDIGVQEPITLFEGMVVDGWHRYTAANELGMYCPSVDLGDVDPQAFVVAKNKARRHITMSQIAAAVVAVYQWRPLGANQHGGSVPGTDPKSTKQLAEIAGVGASTIERAKVVEAKATPEVKAAVKSGAMSVKKAAETVNPPKAKEDTLTPPVKPDLQAPEIDARDQEIVHLREQLIEANEDIAATAKVLDAGDQLATALAEAKSARDLARGLQQRVNSMLTEIAELNRSVKFWKKKAGQPA